MTSPSRPPTDKTKFGSHSKCLLAAVQVLLRRLSNVVEAPDGLRETARRQAGLLQKSTLSEALNDTPVAELRRFRKGLRLGKLEAAGFDTIGKVHRASHHTLQQVPGIGAQTVEEVKDAADEAYEGMSRHTAVRIDLGAKPPEQRRLLAVIQAERNAIQAAAAMGPALDRLNERIGPFLDEVGMASSRARMAFARKETKARATEAVIGLEEVLDGYEVRSLETELQDIERRIDPFQLDNDGAWEAYERDAAGFNTTIASLTGVDSAAAEDLEDFVEAELRQKIEAVPLDVSLLKSTLRMYQVFGTKYAVHQERVIIGDEMGLGKTLQALAVCAHLTAKGQRRFLVVCPASVLANWINEIQTHTSLKAFSLYGPDREAAGRQWMKKGGVAVTSFTTLGRLEFLEERKDIEPSLLVVDEAHYIKNPAAKRSKLVKAANDRAQRTLLLTGTPMENKVDEFKNLVSYVRPSLADRLTGGETIAGARAFRRLVAPVYLRRNQEDVLTELPDKIEVEDWVQLEGAVLDEYRSEVGRRNLMGMRRAASALPGSQKLERVKDLFRDAAAEGQKVVVFSYFLDVLKAVQNQLGSDAMGPITGSVPPQKRQAIIDEFTHRRKPALLLAQIEAGGVGLNIQAASVVIIAEPQWKPSTEQQAIARAHRMGQVRKVQVHRLFAKDSVDERIIEIQEDKELLFDHYARRSRAKESDAQAVDSSFVRPVLLDDESIPLQERVIVAERLRLGMK
ncbi:DEAD/DEAH box helicase [Salininema proteolyticum]|uniref:DEAD/DEAH box helicase n=1 Tax=Salininema proteolyticum TaxID=1607685 RepID=A0ABV8U3X1_9ACTN